ncbi:hypothetical protein O23A_p1226 [Aeromonas salmonicida]|nr:hypothetical protein O23A_p1226 [Aeromonas salmonicida]
MLASYHLLNLHTSQGRESQDFSCIVERYLDKTQNQPSTG